MTAAGQRRVVCFGELLLRLDTPPAARLVQAEQLVARNTGAEANVAVMLASLGTEEIDRFVAGETAGIHR